MSWIQTKSKEDELKYKNYRIIYSTLANKADIEYYNELFNHKTNTIKKLWYNLNVVCSFKPNNRKNNAVPSVFVKNYLLTNFTDVSNGFKYYFSTIGGKPVADLENKYGTLHSDAFKKYIPMSKI